MPTEQPMRPQRRVLVWRSALLPSTETFVRHQAQAYPTWDAHLLGSVRVASPIADPGDDVLHGTSPIERVRAALFHRTGISRRLTREIARLRPDVIHAHFARDAAMIRRHARRAGIPFVVTVHGIDVTTWPREPGLAGLVYRARLARVLRDAAAVVAVSQYARTEAVSRGADPDRVSVLPVGIPIATSAPAADLVYDVAFVGRLIEQKGVLDLFDALAEIAAHGRSVRTVVVGDGPLRADLERIARVHGLDVHFTGALPPHAVAETLRTARIFVAPSRANARGGREAFGLVFLEAALAGLPAIAYASGGVPEAVVDGETGVLVPEGDAAALTAALAALLDDPERAAELGARGRARVIATFDVAEGAAALEALYGTLIG
ncbi:glycosyltransferase [Microbacterium hominis]|uniref:D-inositol 3-phosphate glycosyltransferase n=1 Tax=Microbacterium hominis TaxID=162426 RepID=A0A7D4TRT6_9MICO|nr:glycosyltransferase [Microbacterium hominis]QKJ20264.1 glycosyltransferase [Microbacterium hominis]